MHRAWPPCSTLLSRWLLLAAVGAAGCSPQATSPHEGAAKTEGSTSPLPTTAPAPRWLSSARPDLRALTVVVHASPPEALRTAYRAWGKRFRVLEPVFAEAAEDGFGSGFVVVHRDADGKKKVYVVTNRHVVGLSTTVWVQLGRTDTPIEALVSYVDDLHDLAVLEFRAIDEPQELESGFALATDPAHDQDPVAASGYPGLGDRPSYQVSRGYISNESFVLDEERETPYYLQHTAPIDPGSSGGPLVDAQGRVIGVNTLVARGRANVGLAIPAPYVARALRAVLEEPHVESRRADAGAPERACQELVERLRHEDWKGVERHIGVDWLATEGLASLAVLPKDAEEPWPQRFIEHPTEVLLHASALRLRAALGKSLDEARSSTACTPHAADAASASFRVGGHVLTFGFEQDRFKLVSGALPPVQGKSFLDGLEPRPVKNKKWKPSLR